MAKVQIIIRDMPAELKAALAAEAERDGLTIQHVATRTLVEAFGGAWAANDYPTRAVGDTTTVVLRVPAETRRAINMRAAAEESTSRSVTLAALAARYGMEAPAPRRRRRPDDPRAAAT